MQEFKENLKRIAESLGVEVYELFMFEEGDRGSARKAAIQELVKPGTVPWARSLEADDIRLTASILRQVLERG